jgi:hypothetical protein
MTKEQIHLELGWIAHHSSLFDLDKIENYIVHRESTLIAPLQEVKEHFDDKTWIQLLETEPFAQAIEAVLRLSKEARI